MEFILSALGRCKSHAFKFKLRLKSSLYIIPRIFFLFLSWLSCFLPSPGLLIFGVSLNFFYVPLVMNSLILSWTFLPRHQPSLCLPGCHIITFCLQLQTCLAIMVGLLGFGEFSFCFLTCFILLIKLLELLHNFFHWIIVSVSVSLLLFLCLSSSSISSSSLYLSSSSLSFLPCEWYVPTSLWYSPTITDILFFRSLSSISFSPFSLSCPSYTISTFLFPLFSLSLYPSLFLCLTSLCLL